VRGTTVDAGVLGARVAVVDGDALVGGTIVVAARRDRDSDEHGECELDETCHGQLLAGTS
jgi:hypothetical protein